VKGIVTSLVLALALSGVPMSAAASAGMSLSSSNQQRTENGDPDHIANRLVALINDRKYKRAHRFAAPSVVRKMRTYRNNGYRFARRSYNPCYIEEDPSGDFSSFTCPGELRRRGSLVGSIFLRVDVTADYNKAYDVTISLGE
jgi:hypothetical protein